MVNLLPPNSTLLERALASISAPAGDADVSLIRALWNPDACPRELLPWLAWALSVDMWNDGWDEARQRAVIAGSIPWHRKKGTPWSIRQALAAVGYPVISLIEFRSYFDQWVSAGGRTLDGSWSLEGNVSLNPPIGVSSDVRRMALSHWAEYAIRINTADSPWNRDAQRLIRATAEAYAPARSRLRSIIISGSAVIASPILVTGEAGRVRTAFSRCKRAPVHRWRALDGCWALSRRRSPLRLDGAWNLDGLRSLRGAVPAGRNLDSTFGCAAGRLSTRIAVQAAGGDRLVDAGPLAPSQPLDGSLAIHGRTIDGSWSLNGQHTLDYPTLDSFGLRRLDGTWALGRVHGRPGIWFTAAVFVRRNGVFTREVLQ